LSGAREREDASIWSWYLREELRRSLAKVDDLRDDRITFNWIGYGVYVNHSFISQIEEDVVSRFCFFSSLFVAKDQVNPLVNVV
jgi:hypothetical protein